VKTAAELSDARRALLKGYLRGGIARGNTPAAIPKRHGSGPAPLSYGQRQIWIHSQHAGKTLIYNEPVTIHRHGELDIAALERSFAEIVRRHEAWRTTFEWNDDQPVQIVHPPPSRIEIPFTDLRALPEAQRESEAIRLATEDALQAFDLARGPMYRPRLVRLGDAEHRLFLTLHHIIFDGVSLYRVFLPELQTLYDAFSRNESACLGDLPIQHPDYAVWHRELVQRVSPKELPYWKTVLEDLPVLDLKTDHPRPLVQTYAGEMVTMHISSPVAAALKAVSQENGVTLFMTIVAAFTTLLHGYTGQEDIVIGSVSDVRTHNEIHGLLGFFLNTIVIRSRVSGDIPFTDLLARVKSATLGALSHSTIPFELLVNEFERERDPSRGPLFQVLISVEPPLTPLKDGWDFTQMDVDTGATKFDLHLELDDRPEGLIGRFIYNTALFERQTIHALKSRWLKLLDLIAAGPARRVRDLADAVCRESRSDPSDPAAQERQRLLVEWNQTALAFPREATVAQLFEEQVTRTPEAVALLSDLEAVKYRELNERANQLAHHLRSLGVGPDILVGICLKRSARMLVAILAVLKAGGAYVPLDPAYPKDWLEFILGDAKPPVLLVEHAPSSARPPEGTHVLCLDSDWDKIALERRENPSSGAEPNNLAYVIYTSGSTGKPKGIAMPHGPLLNLLSWQRSVLPGPARTFQFTSICFDVSFQEIFSAWCSGGTLISIPEAVRRDPSGLWNLLASERAERLFLPFVALEQLAEAAVLSEVVPVALRDVITAGEQLRITPRIVELFERLPNCSLHNHYGPTETHVITAFTLQGPPAGWPSLPPIGRPIANTRIYLLDSAMRPVPPGDAGELHVAGESLCRGYLRRPELTGAKFIPNPFEAPPSRLYKTGDLARWRVDGNLEFLGRMDQQVKLRGFRVELGEIESVLCQHPGVLDCAASVREDAPGDRRLVIYWVPANPGGKPPAGGFESQAPAAGPELRAFVNSKLPNYMVPSAFVRLDALPLTPSGKVDRRALPAPDPSWHQATAEFTAPRTPLEKTLAGIWQTLLKVERIGIHENFFELGGESLLGLRLVNRLREMLGCDVSFVTIFEAPTVATLAKLLEKHHSQAVAGLDPQAPSSNAGDSAPMEHRPPAAPSQQPIKRVARDKRSVPSARFS